MISKLPPFTLVYITNPDTLGGGGETPTQATEPAGDPEPPGNTITTGDPEPPGDSESAVMTLPGQPTTPPPDEGTLRGITDSGGPGVPESVSSGSDTAQHHIEAVSRAAPELAESFKSLNLNPNLQQTLLSTSFAQTAIGVDDEQAVATLKPVVADLKRDSEVVTVALWDLNSRSGQLPEVINLINSAQPLFTFFELQGAPLPTGLIGPPQRVEDWVRARLHKRGKRLTKKMRETLGAPGDNFIANEFYKYARVVHKRIGVDYTVGITQSMIAGDDQGEIFWNYFTASRDHLLVTSTYDLRGYARKAGRSFEVALMMLVVAQLLVEMNSRLTFHQDTGCIFDFNSDRASVIESIRALKIDDDCLSKISDKYRQAALAMLDALRSYKGEGEEAPAPEEEEVDYKHWLEQLDKLGEE